MNKEQYIQIHELLTNTLALDPNSIRWDIETILEIHGIYRRHRPGHVTLSISIAGWNHLKTKFPELKLDRRTSFSVWELFTNGYFALQVSLQEGYQTIFDNNFEIQFNRVTFNELGIGEIYSKKYEVIHEHGTAEFLSWTGDYAVHLISKLPSNY